MQDAKKKSVRRKMIMSMEVIQNAGRAAIGMTVVCLKSPHGIPFKEISENGRSDLQSEHFTTVKTLGSKARVDALIEIHQPFLV